jgi:hypothetical protein
MRKNFNKQKPEQTLPQSDTKLYDNISQYLDAKRAERNYENVPLQNNDLTKLVHQLAVYNPDDFTIYKLNIIDWVGMRYECSGKRLSKWLAMEQGVLFNFMNDNEFQHYYQLHVDHYDRPYRPETILDWLKVARRRIENIQGKPEDDPKLKEEKE